MGDKYIAMKLKDQERSLAIIEADPELKDLTKLRGPLLDLEVRGPAALRYFGNMLWAPAFDAMAASESWSVTSSDTVRRCHAALQLRKGGIVLCYEPLQ
jgi:hypothetical protein